MDAARSLARWRVPLGWGLGLAALYLSRPDPALYVLGLGVAAIGELVRIWASGHVQKNRVLTRTGPYAWTRNPLYFGSLWVGLGFALATGRWVFLAVVAVLFVAVYRPVMRRESTHLAGAFPTEYERYRAEVPLFWPRPPGSGAGGRGQQGAGEPSAGFSWARVGANREHWTALGWLAVAAILGWKLP